MITRRHFLGSFALAVTFGLSPLRAKPAASSEMLDPFLKLSAELCGFSTEELDPKLGLLYLNSVLELEPGSLPRLLKLVRPGRVDEPELEALANRIIELWYTGVYSTDEGSQVATFENNLIWKTLDFTEPPSFCGPAWWK